MSSHKSHKNKHKNSSAESTQSTSTTKRKNSPKPSKPSSRKTNPNLDQIQIDAKNKPVELIEELDSSNLTLDTGVLAKAGVEIHSKSIGRLFWREISVLISCLIIFLLSFGLIMAAWPTTDKTVEPSSLNIKESAQQALEANFQKLDTSILDQSNKWIWLYDQTQIDNPNTQYIKFNYANGILSYYGLLPQNQGFSNFTLNDNGQLQATYLNFNAKSVTSDCIMQENNSSNTSEIKLAPVSGNTMLNLSQDQLQKLQDPQNVIIQSKLIDSPEFQQKLNECLSHTNSRASSLQGALFGQTSEMYVSDIQFNGLMNPDVFNFSHPDLQLIKPKVIICPCSDSKYNSIAGAEISGKQLQEKLQTVFQPSFRIKLNAEFTLIDNKSDSSITADTLGKFNDEYILVLNKVHSINDELIDQIGVPKTPAPAPTAAPTPAKKPVVKTGGSKPSTATNQTNNSSSGSTNNSTPAPTQPTPTENTCTQAQFEAKLLCLINNYRAENGKGRLGQNSLMSQAARNHSTWMFNNNVFSHTGENGSLPPDRCAAAGTACRSENIARGSGVTPERVFEAWKASPAHNANMLGNFSQIGLANYNNYVTAVFN
ncbi:MAG: hypothetical protein OHK0017_06420 [Patescibacteria group bacterium]